MVGVPEEIGEGLWLSEEAMEPPLDLVVYGAVEDEVYLYLNLSKMAQVTKLVWPIELVLRLHLKFMRTYSEIAQRNMKSMRSILTCVGRPNNEFVSQLHEVLIVESHLCT